jgi:hypothetical protein
MPKIRIDGYEFFFYSNEGDEDPHVHVYIDGSELKFWINDAMLATRNPRVGSHKIDRLAKVIRKNRNALQGFWDDYQSRR